MSSDAVKEIQKSLNIIKSTIEKENYTTQVKVLELMTQAILSQVQALDTKPLVKNIKKPKNRTRNLAAPSPKPKSQKSPSPKYNPNDTVPSLPQSHSVSVQDINNLHNDFISSADNQ